MWRPTDPKILFVTQAYRGMTKTDTEMQLLYQGLKWSDHIMYFAKIWCNAMPSGEKAFHSFYRIKIIWTLILSRVLCCSWRYLSFTPAKVPNKIEAASNFAYSLSYQPETDCISLVFLLYSFLSSFYFSSRRNRRATAQYKHLVRVTIVCLPFDTLISCGFVSWYWLLLIVWII